MPIELNPPGGEGWHVARNGRAHYFAAQRMGSLCGIMGRRLSHRPEQETAATRCKTCDRLRTKLEQLMPDGRTAREVRREAEIWAAAFQAPPMMGDDGSI